MTPLTIGWKERVDFPDLGITGLRVKMDTGARTSAADGAIDEVREISEKLRVVVCRLYLGKKRKSVQIVAPLIRLSRVKCTSGVVIERFVIETTIRIGPTTKQIELAVANRQSMLSSVIFGRRALANDFLVDPSRKYVLSSKHPVST